MHSYAHCVREDPVKKGMLYLGTENAMYLSLDDGRALAAAAGRPAACAGVRLTIQEHFNDLVVATYGRGFWILDDITPLRQLTSQVGDRAHLFPPRPAYRFRPITNDSVHPRGRSGGGQRPAICGGDQLLLKDGPQAGKVTITILDRRGR